MQTFTTTAPITAILAIPTGRIRFSAADRDTTSVEIGPADPSKSRDVKLGMRCVYRNPHLETRHFTASWTSRCGN